jgi:ribosomal protein S18 acetylase RimI-like enzyme
MDDMIERNAIEIRAATSSDAETLGHFGAALMAMHHHLDHKRFIEATARTPTMYAEYLKRQSGQKGSLVLVAARKGAVVGYVFAQIEGPDYMALRGPAGVIQDIFVEPSHRGNGAGRALFDAAVLWIGQNGSPRVVLSTAYANDAAQRLFKSAGLRFTMVEMTRDFDDD